MENINKIIEGLQSIQDNEEVTTTIKNGKHETKTTYTPKLDIDGTPFTSERKNKVYTYFMTEANKITNGGSS